MKTFLVLFLVLSISVKGQNAATQNLSELSGDSVNIHAMVQKEISIILENVPNLRSVHCRQLKKNKSFG